MVVVWAASPLRPRDCMTASLASPTDTRTESHPSRADPLRAERPMSSGQKESLQQKGTEPAAEERTDDVIRKQGEQPCARRKVSVRRDSIRGFRCVPVRRELSLL